MLNQVQIMGRIASMPKETKTAKKEYVFQLEVEKNFEENECIYLDVALWKGKYLQMKAYEDLIGSYVMIKGRLDILDLKYEEDEELMSTNVIVCEDLEYLSKYTL